jgi:hypothetical protein
VTLAGLVNQAYPSPEWVVFFEVSNATGFQAKRRADAVALGVWPSRGHALVGFEFKEHRGDWLNEKKNPEKADVIASHCDAWYVVAGRKNVVNVEELPEPWGLYVANDDRTRMTCVKPCVPFEGRDKTVIRRSFAASMLRKIGETMVPKVELDRLVNERLQEAVERSTSGYQLKQLEARVAQLEGILSTFKNETGIDLAQSWRGPKKIAKAVDALLSGWSHKEQLKRQAEQLERTAQSVRDVLADWPETITDDEEAAS